MNKANDMMRLDLDPYYNTVYQSLTYSPSELNKFMGKISLHIENFENRRVIGNVGPDLLYFKIGCYTGESDILWNSEPDNDCRYEKIDKGDDNNEHNT